ncbi:MAG: LCP family protein [Acidimicrobiia bacterium]|nr:LCP family protein [Acidimicrobiia bacterium]
MTPPPGDAPDSPPPDGSVPRGWGRAEPPTEPPPSSGDRPPVAPRQYFVPADAASSTGHARRDADPRGRLPAAPPPGAPSRMAVSAPPIPIEPHPVQPSRGAGRRRWSARRIALVAILVLLGCVVFFLLYGLWQFSRIERVPVADVLSSGGSGTNYLIVGSDSREGFDPNDPNAGAVLGDGAGEPGAGERSDTMLILRTGPDGALMTSIPRDLFVTRSDGSQGRINAAYRDGPASLIQTVQQGVGIPVHHYVEVDFVTFAGLVDAVGGVQIELPNPARDTHSGLNLPEAGTVTLDGVQGLAYVRSRRYEELTPGGWVADPTGDLGRVQRQQLFLRSVMGEVGSTRNPIELMRISSAVSGGLRIDDSMGAFDALSFARSLRGLQPESVALPTYPFRTDGGAAVLGLVEPDAASVIARFNG